MHSIRAVLFDLDGTLVHSVPDITAAINHALGAMGVASVSVLQVQSWVGKGIACTLERALDEQLGEPNPALVEQAEALFSAYYPQHCCVHSALYPGVRETLSGLAERKIKMAIVTNKDTRSTHALLAQLELKHYFDAIVCGDSAATKKPSPEPIKLAIKQLQCEGKQAVMVGDSSNDLYAARAAGVASIAVAYGYAQGFDLASLASLAVVNTLPEINNFV